MDRYRPGSRLLIALSLIALSLSLGSGTVFAHSAGAHLLNLHPRDGAHAHHELPSGALATGLALAGLAALVGARMGRHRWLRGPAFALALSLAVAVFGLEAAVHSVHHLGNPESAAACVVLAGSQHLSWAEGGAEPLDARPFCVSAPPLPALDPIPPAQIHRPHLGRAPPA
jgi:hypothetical protein